MRSGSNLRRRASAYQFRFALPRRLATFCNRREIILGLRTTNHAVALRRARVLRVAVEALMAELELTTIKADAERRIRAWVDTQIAQFENGFARTGLAYVTEEEASLMGPETAEETDKLLRLVARTQLDTTIRPAISAILGGRQAQARKTLAPAITAACAEAGIEAAALEGAAEPLIERVLLRGFATPHPRKRRPEAPACAMFCSLRQSLSFALEIGGKLDAAGDRARCPSEIEAGQLEARKFNPFCGVQQQGIRFA